MLIAFYSPLKSPNHPVPSGDRLMARLLISAMEMAGHEVTVASELRSFVKDSMSQQYAEIETASEVERERIYEAWQADLPPDLWFTYHPYYKAPDRLGPVLSARISIPYVTAEASYSNRRNIGQWVDSQSRLLGAINQAAVNICMTERDRQGLEEAAPRARFAMLKPFIDTAAFLAEPRPEPNRLVTVAMMRAGDKLESYQMLARALSLLMDRHWQLTIIGGGPEEESVKSLFAGLAPERIVWLGEKSTEEIAARLSRSSLYLWPGCGEAYGLAYLEAQAAGLPVVAQDIAGVPEVVMQGKSAILTRPGDIGAYAEAIRDLLDDDAKRSEMAKAARAFVFDERSLQSASPSLDIILKRAVRGHR